MSVIEMSKSMGNSYSPEVEEQYNKQKKGGAAAAPSASAGVPPPPNVSSAGPAGGGEAIQNASRANADLKSEKESQANNIIVNAPTTNNSGSNQQRSPEIRAPLRNQDSTVNTYIDSRYR